MSSLRNEVLVLYKALLREGSKFSNYNFRMYAIRRVKDSFRKDLSEVDPLKIKACITYGKQSLDSLKRQVIVENLYKVDNLVIEKKTA